MTDTIVPSALTAPLFSSSAMRAVLTARARLQRMLDFEAALARAEAAVGVIPAGAAGEIGDACRIDRYDVAALCEAAAATGDLVTPLVAALTAEVAKRHTHSANFVHWGASTQDVIDTALVLELRAAIDVLFDDLDRATRALTTLTGRHRRTMTMARASMQQAVPMPFGLKIAGYAAALARSRERLRRVRREALALQFGGAGGTLAALGEDGLDVSERLAALLDLPHPDAPWHSQRDRLADIATAFAILAGSCGKIARDVSLLMQSEVDEASVLVHGSAAATAALSAAAMAPNLAATILAALIQEHEHAPAGLQSEAAVFPALALIASGALQAAADIAEGLEVNTERMKQNLEASGGVVFAEAVTYALAPTLGRAQAHDLVEELARKATAGKRLLQDELAADDRIKAQLDGAALARLFRPTNYQGSAQTFIDRLVASSQGRLVRRPTEIRPRMPEIKPAETAIVPPPEPAKSPVEPPRPAAEPPLAMAEVASLQPESPAPEPAMTPNADAPPPPAEEPSALIEAFARVAAAAEQMGSTAPADRDRKPT